MAERSYSRALFGYLAANATLLISRVAVFCAGSAFSADGAEILMAEGGCFGAFFYNEAAVGAFFIA